MHDLINQFSEPKKDIHFPKTIFVVYMNVGGAQVFESKESAMQFARPSDNLSLIHI